MDGGGIVVLLIAAGIVFSWIYAGIMAHKRAGSKGVTNFFVHLILAATTVFVMWMIIVYPVLYCSGFLCGLGEVILWIILSGITLLLWPLILLPIFKRKYGEIEQQKSNEELIDDIL